MQAEPEGVSSWAKEIVQVTGVPAPHAGAPYSQLVRCGPLVFSSGQIAAHPQTSALVGDDIAGQTEQVMANLGAVLASAGSSLAQILSATIYLADLDDWAGMNEVYARHVGQRPPARAAVQVGLPEGVLIEVSVIAHVPS